MTKTWGMQAHGGQVPQSHLVDKGEELEDEGTIVCVLRHLTLAAGGMGVRAAKGAVPHRHTHTHDHKTYLRTQNQEGAWQKLDRTH